MADKKIARKRVTKQDKELTMLAVHQLVERLELVEGKLSLIPHQLDTTITSSVQQIKDAGNIRIESSDMNAMKHQVSLIRLATIDINEAVKDRVIKVKRQGGKLEFWALVVAFVIAIVSLGFAYFNKGKTITKYKIPPELGTYFQATSNYDKTWETFAHQYPKEAELLQQYRKSQK